MNTKCLISVIALTSSIGLFTSTASVAAPNVCGNGGWSLFGFASNGDCNSSLRNGALTWQILYVAAVI